MSYPMNNAPFVDDGIYEDDDGDDGSYEPDSEEKSKKKPARKSTKGRKLKRWDGEFRLGDASVSTSSHHRC